MWHAKNRLSLIPLAVVWFLLTGCVTPAPLPRAEESANFLTLESGFHIIAREGTIRYAITLEPMAPLEDTLFFRAVYENPLDPDEPYVEEGEWQAEKPYLLLRSPPLAGLEVGQIYRVRITFFKEPDRTQSIDEHEVLIYSNIDTRSHGR